MSKFVARISSATHQVEENRSPVWFTGRGIYAHSDMGWTGPYVSATQALDTIGWDANVHRSAW